MNSKNNLNTNEKSLTLFRNNIIIVNPNNNQMINNQMIKEE